MKPAQQALTSLEYASLLELVAAHSQTAGGREKVLSLTPLSSCDEIGTALSLVSEMIDLHTNESPLSLGGLVDIREWLRACMPAGAILSPGALADIFVVLQHCEGIVERFRRSDLSSPRLREMVSQLAPLEKLAGRIERTIGPDGEIRDDASAELKKIRNRIYKTRELIYEKLDGFMSRQDMQPVIQDRVVTQRNQRFVVPIRVESKSRVDGIIHDQSASGATLFIEPLAVLPLNNTLLQERLAEEREIKRILAELTDGVREKYDALTTNVTVLMELDMVQAKTFFARRNKAVVPRVVEKGPFEIYRGRHPLLLHYLGHEQVVPLDILIDEAHPILLISGPNMGGKTVTLKTAGLLAMMAQSGLPVTASPDSVFPVFSAIYTDIGDQQDLSQSISTFASHLNRIRDILESAGPDSLVLLDELGTGTDPDEGGALGMMVLNEMLTRRTCTIATTHLNQLKQQMIEQSEKMVASVIFDQATGKPTYQLLYGQSGESNAFAIAARLGIAPVYIEKARGYLNPFQIRLNEMRENLERRRTELDARESEITRRMEQLSLEREESQKRCEVLEREIRSEGRRQMAQVHERIRFLHRQLSESELNRKTLEDVTIAVEEVETEFFPPEVPAEESRETATLAEIDEVTSVETVLREGQTVHIPSLNRNGEITDLIEDRGLAIVVSSGMKFKLPLDQLRPIVARPSKTAVTNDAVISFDGIAEERNLPHRLSLRGERVDAALMKLDKYLDDAFLSSMPRVSIVHGIGEERLRPAIWSLLEKHPHVSAYRAGDPIEGGFGVTIVDLHHR